MAITATPYGAFYTDLGTGVHHFGTDTYKVALLLNTYTPNFNTHVAFSDVSATEVSSSGTGYTTGGVALTTVTLTYSSGTGIATVNADPVLWSSLTATTRYAIVYRSTGTNSTSRLVALFDFGADRVYSSEPFQMSFPSGVVTIQAG